MGGGKWYPLNLLLYKRGEVVHPKIWKSLCNIGLGYFGDIVFYDKACGEGSYCKIGEFWR